MPLAWNAAALCPFAERPVRHAEPLGCRLDFGPFRRFAIILHKSTIGQFVQNVKDYLSNDAEPMFCKNATWLRASRKRTSTTTFARG